MQNSYKKEMKKRLFSIYLVIFVAIFSMATITYIILTEERLKNYRIELEKNNSYTPEDIYKGMERVPFVTKLDILSSSIQLKDIVIYPTIHQKQYKLYYTQVSNYYMFLIRPLISFVIIFLIIDFLFRSILTKALTRLTLIENFLNEYFTHATINKEICSQLSSYDDEISKICLHTKELMSENLLAIDTKEKLFKTLEKLNEIVLELSYEFHIEESNKPWKNYQKQSTNFLNYISQKNVALLQLKSPDLKANKIDEIIFVDSLGDSLNHYEIKLIHVHDGFGVIIGDITTLYKKHKDIQHKALHDSLTNLPNRTLFLDRLESEIKKSQRLEKTFALLFFDLDKFKVINDTYGHQLGDAYLIEFSKRVSKALRASDTCARLGGDEFVAILSNMKGFDQIETILNKITESLKEEFRFGEHSLKMKASVGISLYPDDGDDGDILLLKADNAMYKCKKSGETYCRYIQEL
ncbi:diguanylate cyclase [Sulfurimonas aquatica]|uniref:Diguanylate cyclase n=1 Tax=Sulfurimonas aquatica TaxID=2672570 RepID=A0A975AYB1_9BACT|nr:GGDEF domain-containing protein [Sulfurimonas aquatica]QSZ40784.1 diguanylate cyclase [Sulfurimonas aquatica]